MAVRKSTDSWLDFSRHYSNWCRRRSRWTGASSERTLERVTQLHKRLKRALKKARRARIKQRGQDVADLDDDAYRQLWRDHASATRQRAKNRWPGPTRTRLQELLVAELKALGFADLQRGGNSEWWWGGRFRYRHACEHVAKHLPKGLFKQKRISWRTVRTYTREEFSSPWLLAEARREAQAKDPGLLRDL